MTNKKKQNICFHFQAGIRGRIGARVARPVAMAAAIKHDNEFALNRHLRALVPPTTLRRGPATRSTAEVRHIFTISSIMPSGLRQSI